MSLVKFAASEITCKIVYYGPGRSGKTTNLQYIFGRVPEGRRGQMVSLATHTDRTLFFDFLPLDLGTISGFVTRFQLYTVPGQSYYASTRKLVLQGADGLVFVADSQARRVEDNIESLQDLHQNLLDQGVDARQLPIVFQYNKQDLPRDLILTPGELERAANDTVRRVITLQQGIPADAAREIVKFLKDRKLKKVQVAIQADQVRVSSPSKDELQEAIRVLREHDFGVALQFGNYRG